jgi:hypothetical protein
MSPDTNNNVGNEGDDETDEEEDEDEPVFKYSEITISSGLRKTNDNSKNIPPEFSCIAVHEKFLVIGKTTGEILITDHLGNIIPQYQIKAVIILLHQEIRNINFVVLFSTHIQ